MNARAHAAGISTVADRLDRAITLGRELRGIREDPALHRLAYGAWREFCFRLADVPGEVELDRIRWTIQEKCPALAAEIEVKGKLWAGQHQDRPAVFRFLDPDRWPAVYAEMLVTRITDHQASALAAWRCMELRTDPDFSQFGKLRDFEQLEAMLEERRAALRKLDDELAGTVLLRMLSWSASGPTLRHGGYELVLDQGNATMLASALAELVQRQPMALPAAA